MRSSTTGFQGSRLREAREARGLSAQSLSELVDVTAPNISHYESNRHAPSPQVLSKLADVLKVSPLYFVKPPRQAGERIVFWRSREKATQLQRAKALQKHCWFLDIVDYQSRFIQFPKVDFPNTEIPADPRMLTPENIEDLAVETRFAWSMGEGPVGNLVGVLEKHGVIVARKSVDAEYLDAFSEWRNEDNRPYITLASDKESDARSRFDAGHELGHMILHRGITLRDFNTSVIHSLMEQQAMRFSGAFLLPAAEFSDDLYSISLDAFRDLKAKWRVSISAMICRAADLGLIDEKQEKRLWMNMSRRKWRKREPGDDQIAPEQPNLIQQGFDMLLENGIVDPQRMAAEIGIRVRDIEDVTGLPEGYLHARDHTPLKFRLAQ